MRPSVILALVSNEDKPQLLQTCKVLRQAVLQQEPRLSLLVGELGSDRSYREASAVILRQQPFEYFTLHIGNKPWQQAQRLQSELAAAEQRPRAVSSLVVVCERGFTETDINGCEGLLGSFSDINSLELCDVRITSLTLEALSQCRSLAKLCENGCLFSDDIYPEDLGWNLPAVRELGFTSFAMFFIPGLGDQLTRLEYFESPLEAFEDTTLEALRACQNLVELDMKIDQDRLGALLELPYLTKVTCRQWAADTDAEGRSCTWSHLDLDVITSERQPDTLPRGIDTLNFRSLKLPLKDTPGASLEASRAMAGAALSACRCLSFSKPNASLPLIVIEPEVLPSHLAATCVAASLQGLATLHPILNSAGVELILKRTELQGDMVHALSPISAYLHELNIQCRVVAPDAWAALPAALPAMRSCVVEVGWLAELSWESIFALSMVCFTPRGMDGNTALRTISVVSVEFRWRQRSASLGLANKTAPTKCAAQTALEQLQAVLEASRAPVQLLLQL